MFEWDSEMAKRKKPDYSALSMTSSIGLRGMQSVRASFRLTPDCIETISIVSAQLGIKQKSLFDHLLKDNESIIEIAKKLRGTKLKVEDRVQKTFVISRSTLEALDEVAKAYEAPRNALIEFSVQRLLPIIATERKRHALRQEICTRLGTNYTLLKEILKDAEEMLGVDDPAYTHMAPVLEAYASAKKTLSGFIDKGKGIENFSPENLKSISLEYEDD
jgi:predicted DNA-binding protein YlxM (UPF0122 family)